MMVSLFFPILPTPHLKGHPGLLMEQIFTKREEYSALLYFMQQ